VTSTAVPSRPFQHFPSIADLLPIASSSAYSAGDAGRQATCTTHPTAAPFGILRNLCLSGPESPSHPQLIVLRQRGIQYPGGRAKEASRSTCYDPDAPTGSAGFWHGIIRDQPSHAFRHLVPSRERASRRAKATGRWPPGFPRVGVARSATDYWGHNGTSACRCRSHAAGGATSRRNTATLIPRHRGIHYANLRSMFELVTRCSRDHLTRTPSVPPAGPDGVATCCVCSTTIARGR